MSENEGYFDDDGFEEFSSELEDFDNELGGENEGGEGFNFEDFKKRRDGENLRPGESANENSAENRNATNNNTRNGDKKTQKDDNGSGTEDKLGKETENGKTPKRRGENRTEELEEDPFDRKGLSSQGKTNPNSFKNPNRPNIQNGDATKVAKGEAGKAAGKAGAATGGKAAGGLSGKAAYAKDAADVAKAAKDGDATQAGMAATKAGAVAATDAATGGVGGDAARMVLESKVGETVLKPIGMVGGNAVKYGIAGVGIAIVLVGVLAVQLVGAIFSTMSSTVAAVAGGAAGGAQALCENERNGGNASIVNTGAQVSESEEENAKTIYIFLISNGVTPAGAAGILGNIQEESRFNPSAIEANGTGEGHGLVQWSFSRRYDLMMRASSKGVNWDDMAFQLDFLLYEMRQPYYKTTWDMVTTVQSPSDAAYEFHRLFERSADNRSMIQERLDAANYWAEKFKDVKPVKNRNRSTSAVVAGFNVLTVKSPTLTAIANISTPQDVLDVENGTNVEGESGTTSSQPEPGNSPETPAPAESTEDESETSDSMSAEECEELLGTSGDGEIVYIGDIPVDPNGWGLPMATYNLTDSFGTRGGAHKGLDLSSWNGTNEAILAVRGGVVAYAYGGCNYVGSLSDYCGMPPYGGYGNVVLIDHGDGYQTLYAHLSSVSVKQGQEVKRSQVLGKQGSTGQSSGNHLHFELKKNGTAIDPQGQMRIPSSAQAQT